jgi:hypothetical protein
MSISSLTDYLVAKIKSVDGVDPSFVYPFENPQMPGYPCIGVTLKEWKGKFLTNMSNERTYMFTVRIYQEATKTNMGPEDADSNLRALADSLIAAFDGDNRLGGSDVYTLPVAGRMLWMQGEPIRVMEVDVECHDVVQAVG